MEYPCYIYTLEGSCNIVVTTDISAYFYTEVLKFAL
jgi:hypothetical protein